MGEGMKGGGALRGPLPRRVRVVPPFSASKGVPSLSLCLWSPGHPEIFLGGGVAVTLVLVSQDSVRSASEHREAHDTRTE